jgi:hypothetical protein
MRNYELEKVEEYPSVQIRELARPGVEEYLIVMLTNDLLPKLMP